VILIAWLCLEPAFSYLRAWGRFGRRHHGMREWR